MQSHALRNQRITIGCRTRRATRTQHGLLFVLKAEEGRRTQKRAALSSSGHLQIRCRLFAALPISLDIVCYLHALSEAAHARSLNSADMHEHVLAALVGLDKPVALRRVEPLYSTSSHDSRPIRVMRTGPEGSPVMGGMHQPERSVTTTRA